VNWLQIIFTSVIPGVVLALFGALVTKRIETRITEKIRTEYARLLEEYKEQIRWGSLRREKAAAVADVFAAWIAHRYDKNCERHAENFYLHELQRKYWELSLWLDAPALKLVNSALTSDQGGSIKYKEALAAVRKIIQGDPEDPIQPGDWVHWNAKE